MYRLRDYQQDAVDSTIAYVKKRTAPCLLELATGSGKSLIVANIAMFFAKAAPHKRVLCLAPSKELVLQNHEKYLAYEYPASIFCASAGKKSLRQQVIFASPQTAAKQVERIARLGVSAIIIDEAHGITKTMKAIISDIKGYTEKGVKPNSKVRVIGLTATPYRLGTGYIYATDTTVTPYINYDESEAIEPYFNKLLYRVSAGELVSQGYLIKPTIGEVNGDAYDTSGLKTDSMGKITAKSQREAFEGKTKTERIIHRVVNRAIDRKGVMIFGATISHAEEICSYLPMGEWAIVTGKTKKKERTEIIAQFKAQRVKYIVNVDVLTTGFDAPHVDLVAVLRATESPGLLQQIIGRGLRLCENKDNCLILDFAENIKRHGLEDDIFTPEIKTKRVSAEGEKIEVVCPSCGCHTLKKRRNDPMYTGLEHDEFGNFLIAGTKEVLTMQVLDPSVKDEFGVYGIKEIPVPAHYSRRCSNPEAYVIKGESIPCNHRFSFKVCPHCFTENDVAARHCTKCHERLVDPNNKLTESAGHAVVMQDNETRVVACSGAEYAIHEGKSGGLTLKVSYQTEIGRVTGWHSQKQHWIFNNLARANGADPRYIRDIKSCEGWDAVPKSIKIKKIIRGGYTRFEIKEVSFA